MMTLILVVSALLITFIGLLRYDIHKHKHRAPANPNPPCTNPPGSAAAQPADADEHHDNNKT